MWTSVSPCLGQHLLLVLVHVHGVGARGLGLRVWVDLTRPQPPRWGLHSSTLQLNLGRFDHTSSRSPVK